MIDDEPRPVWMSPLVTHIITAGVPPAGFVKKIHEHKKSTNTTKSTNPAGGTHLQ